MSEVKERVNRIIERFVNVRINEMEDHNNIKLIEDLGIGSIELIELVLELETEFNIELDDEDMQVESINEYDKLLSIITKHLKEY